MWEAPDLPGQLDVTHARVIFEHLRPVALRIPPLAARGVPVPVNGVAVVRHPPAETCNLPARGQARPSGEAFELLGGDIGAQLGNLARGGEGQPCRPAAHRLVVVEDADTEFELLGKLAAVEKGLNPGTDTHFAPNPIE